MKEDLERRIRDYEQRFVPSAPSAQQRAWQNLRTHLNAMLVEKKAPAVGGKAHLPVILIATPEVVSLPSNMGNLANIVTTGDGGGLADISAALIAELDRRGMNVHVAVPEYETLFEAQAHVSHQEYVALKRGLEDKTRVHLIEDDMFTSASRVYGDMRPGLDKIDLRRANAFMRGIISRLFPFLLRGNEHVLVHCNDWMTGLIPAAAKANGIHSLMTFHNIFTTHQWPKGLQKHSIDIRPFWRHLYFARHPDSIGEGTFEANYESNYVDFMNSGLMAADFINTVSPSFLNEIVEGYFSEHFFIPDSMRQVIRTRYHAGEAKGILNAPSLQADPRVDTMIAVRYWHSPGKGKRYLGLMAGKRENKRVAQRELALKEDADAALFFWPSRIAAPQKGFELLLAIIPRLIEMYPLQIAVVANGDAAMIAKIQKIQSEYPGRVSYRAFDRRLSHRVRAAADFILMPSLYEPCGIPQVEGPRYGTLPVVRRTGGLADTVFHLSASGLIGNGFTFDDYDSDGLMYGVSQAMVFYEKSVEFKEGVLKRIMKESFDQFNIEKTAHAYIELYEEIFRRRVGKIKIR